LMCLPPPPRDLQFDRKRGYYLGSPGPMWMNQVSNNIIIISQQKLRDDYLFQIDFIKWSRNSQHRDRERLIFYRFRRRGCFSS
jgi:hypothetical protein